MKKERIIATNASLDIHQILEQNSALFVLLMSKLNLIHSLIFILDIVLLLIYPLTAVLLDSQPLQRQEKVIALNAKEIFVEHVQMVNYAFF